MTSKLLKALKCIVLDHVASPHNAHVTELCLAQVSAISHWLWIKLTCKFKCIIITQNIENACKSKEMVND